MFLRRAQLITIITITQFIECHLLKLLFKIIYWQYINVASAYSNYPSTQLHKKFFWKSPIKAWRTFLKRYNAGNISVYQKQEYRIPCSDYEVLAWRKKSTIGMFVPCCIVLLITFMVHLIIWVLQKTCTINWCSFWWKETTHLPWYKNGRFHDTHPLLYKNI